MTVPRQTDQVVISSDPYIQNKFEELITALEFYANKNRYGKWNKDLEKDRGAIARQALEVK